MPYEYGHISGSGIESEKFQSLTRNRLGSDFARWKTLELSITWNSDWNPVTEQIRAIRNSIECLAHFTCDNMRRIG